MRYIVPALGGALIDHPEALAVLGDRSTARMARPPSNADVAAPSHPMFTGLQAWLDKFACTPVSRVAGEKGEVTFRANLPDAEDVERYMRFLARPAFEPPADYSGTVPAWFETYDPTEHTLPERWVADSPIGPIVEHACAILGGGLAAAAARRLKEHRSYPPNWGRAESKTRGMLERLFDRLHINHDDDGSRVVTWQTEDGDVEDPAVTVIGVRHPDNPYWRLRERMAEPSLGLLATVIGLENMPQMIALPLDARQCSSSSVLQGLRSALPEQVRSDLRAVADDLDAVLGNIAPRPLQHLPLLVPGPAALIRAIVLAARAEIADAFTLVPGRLRRAALEDITLRHVAERLLVAVDVIDFRGITNLVDAIHDALRALFPNKFTSGDSPFSNLDNLEFLTGLQGEDLNAIMGALVSEETPSPTVTIASDIIPRDLGSRLIFERPLAAEGGPASGFLDVVWTKKLVAKAWETWWIAAQPIIDAAWVFDTAGRLAEQLVHLDDELLAANHLATEDGVIGTGLRSTLYDAGLRQFADAIGGISPAAVVGCLVRQILTDNFIEHFADQHGIDRECLYPFFCWMDTREKRNRIQKALGRLDGVDLTDALDTNVYERFLALNAPTERLYLRDGISGGTPGDLARAAVWNVIDHLKGTRLTLSRLPEIDAAISLCDIGDIRAWVADGRSSCLSGLAEKYTPDWAYFDREPGDAPTVFPEGIPLHPELVPDDVDILPGREDGGPAEHG